MWVSVRLVPVHTGRSLLGSSLRGDLTSPPWWFRPGHRGPEPDPRVGGGESFTQGEGNARRVGDAVTMPKPNDALTGAPARSVAIPRQDQHREAAVVGAIAIRSGWWGPTVRTLGIEEELLIVDATTGQPLALSEQVKDLAPSRLRGG